MIPPVLRSAHRLGLGLLALALTAAAAAPAALAQSAKIFVSSTGKDTNAGSLGAPMRTFQAAHDAVAAGGEIVVLNTAGYSGLTITKSVAITVPTGVTGFITTTGSGITINAAATDVVILRGLTIEGGNAQSAYGILATAVGTLRVDNCTIRSFSTGILLNADGGKLEVNGGAVRDCAASGIGVTSVTATNPLNANVTGCKIDNMPNYGVYAVGNSTSGTLATVTATNCVISHCQTDGVFAFTAGATVYVDGCILSGNAAAAGGVGNGAVISRVSNTLVNNTLAASGFTSTLAAQ